MVGVFHHVFPYDRGWKAAETSLLEIGVPDLGQLGAEGDVAPSIVLAHFVAAKIAINPETLGFTLISPGSPVKNWDLREMFDGYNHSKWGFHHTINDTQ